MARRTVEIYKPEVGGYLQYLQEIGAKVVQMIDSETPAHTLITFVA